MFGNKKKKILCKAFKKAEEPLWFVFYESENDSGSIKVYANSDSEAREKANYMISDILAGRNFVIVGTAAI